MPGILEDRDGASAAHVESLAVRLFFLEHEHVGLDHILHMHEVAGLMAIFVEQKRLMLKGASTEDAAHPGVVVVQRLPLALRNGVAQRHGGDAVQPSESKSGLFLRQFGNGVLVIGIVRSLVEGQCLGGAPARGARHFPVTALKFLSRTRHGLKVAMIRAAVLAFAVHSLGRGYNDFFHRQPVPNDEFEQKRRTHGIDFKEAGKIRHVILISRVVGNNVDPLQAREEHLAISNLAANELGGSGHVARQAVGMNPGIEAIENYHLEAIAQETVCQVRSNESGATGYKNAHESRKAPSAARDWLKNRLPTAVALTCRCRRTQPRGYEPKFLCPGPTTSAGCTRGPGAPTRQNRSLGSGR